MEVNQIIILSMISCYFEILSDYVSATNWEPHTRDKSRVKLDWMSCEKVQPKNLSYRVNRDYVNLRVI